MGWIHLDQDRASGELLWTRWWTFKFHRRREIP